MGIAQWIPNFSARLAQLDRIARLETYIGVEVWLGGLFFPEAYVTATRQAVAQRNSWSLETLYLELLIDEPNDSSAFVVQGKLRHVQSIVIHINSCTLQELP
jgi:dynein heavy chain 1